MPLPMPLSLLARPGHNRLIVRAEVPSLKDSIPGARVRGEDTPVGVRSPRLTEHAVVLCPHLSPR